MAEIDAPGAPAAPGTARNVLIVLTFVNLFNYIDRFIVPGITVRLGDALHLNDTQIGSLATGFILVYALAAPRFGELGDIRHRPKLIALGVAIWSVATVLGGFAIGFISLLLARATLGIGEAAYGSIAPSLLADTFPKERRGRVFAIFYSAIPIGSALGYVIAGAMGEHFGWRSAFWVAGAPGLVLAALLVKLPEVPRGGHDDAEDAVARHAAPKDASRWATYGGLLRNRQYRLTVLGYAAYTFAIGALAVWLPKFLIQTHHYAQDSAAYLTGAIAVATGFVGTFAGGWLADYMQKHTRHGYLLMSGVATLLAVPFTIVALTAEAPMVFLGALIVAELLMFASTGPINSAIVSYVAPTQRATAMAFSILLMHLLGDAPSPLIVGFVSDLGRSHGMDAGHAIQRAMLMLPAAILVSGIIWTVGAEGGNQPPRIA